MEEGQGWQRGLGRGREQVVEAPTLPPDADASVPAPLPVPHTEASLKGLSEAGLTCGKVEEKP